MSWPRAGALLPQEGVVAEVHDLGARLRRVVVAAPALSRLGRFQPGQEFSLRPPGGWFREGGRTYTALGYDRGRGRLEFIGFLHGRGPASRMIAALTVGDRVGVWGFGGPLKVDAAATTHVVIGDESAVGAAIALAAATGDACRGALETDADHVPALAAALVALGAGALTAVARRPVRGGALVDWLTASPAPSDAAHYLLGHGQSVVATRAAARHRGTPEARLHARAYWVDGRRG